MKNQSCLVLFSPQSLLTLQCSTVFRLCRSLVLLFFLLQIFYTELHAAGRDAETNTFGIQPYDKNYLIVSADQGGNGDCDAKIQISFLSMFKSKELPNHFPYLSYRFKTPKWLNFGFNYTQTFFDDLCRQSLPIVSTDYKPGLFLSFQESKEPEGFALRQTVIGWDHQSNGESEGLENRGWDRLYAEVLFGLGPAGELRLPNAADLTEGQDQAKQDSIAQFILTGEDKLNLRLRVAHDWLVSDDNPDIADFYGLYEAELSYHNRFGEFGLAVSRGNKKGHVRFEYSTKFVPGLAHINRAINESYGCQTPKSKNVFVDVLCFVRYGFAVFDLEDNHGSWMLQVFDGYGERIRDFNIRTDTAVRFGYRFSS